MSEKTAESHKYDRLNDAVKYLPILLNEMNESVAPKKLEIRSVCFHREDPMTGGKWYIRVRGHIKTATGVVGFQT